MNYLYHTDTHKNNLIPYDFILVLVHGNITSSQHWCKFIQELQKRDQDKKIRIINLDQLGFGYSQNQPTNIDSIEDLSNAIHNLIINKFNNEEIKQKLILCGWSLGGAVCMQLATNYSFLYQKLILIASASCNGNHLYQEDQDGRQLSTKCINKEEIINHSKIKHNVYKMKQNDYNYFHYVFKKALFNSGRYPSDLELLELLQDVFKQTNYIDVAWALQKFDITKQVNKINGPVLIYHGQLDKICPLSDAYTNMHYIGKNKCTLIVHQSVSHMPPLEVPEDLAVHIINYLQGLTK